MSLAWEKVIEKPEFKELPDEEKLSARQEYFDDVVKPHINESEYEPAQKEFFEFDDSLKKKSLFNKFMYGKSGSLKGAVKAVGKQHGDTSRVTGAAMGGLAVMPAAGLAATGKLISDPLNLRSQRTVAQREKQAMEVFHKITSIPQKLIQTEDQQKLLEQAMKPLEWVETATTFYGDKAAEKWGATVGASVKTVMDLAVYFGLPVLKAKLVGQIKAGNLKGANTTINLIKDRTSKTVLKDRTVYRIKNKPSKISKQPQPLIKPKELHGQKQTISSVREQLKDISVELQDFGSKTPQEKVSLVRSIKESERGSIEIQPSEKAKFQKLKSEDPNVKAVSGMYEKETALERLHGGALKAWTKDMGANAIIRWLDRFHPLKKASPEGYDSARTFLAHKDVAGLKFAELIEGMEGVRAYEDLFTSYVTAKRAFTRAERGIKNPIPKGGGEPVSLEQASGAIKSIEAEFAKMGKTEALNTAFKNFQNWADKYILQEAVGGIISKETYAKIKEGNEFYASFDVLDNLPKDIENLPSLSSPEYFSVANQKAIKKMKGTEKRIANPIEATVRKFITAQGLYERNKVANIVLNDLEKLNLSKRVVGSFKQKQALKEKGIDSVIEGHYNKKEFDLVSVFRDGRVEKYSVPKEFADVMKQLKPYQAPKWIHMLNSVFRKSATTLYVPFTISNAFRDALMAYTTSPVYKGSPLGIGGFAKDWAGGLAQGAKHEFLGGAREGWRSKLNEYLGGSDIATAYIKDKGSFGYAGNIRNAKLAKADLFKKSGGRFIADVIRSPFDLIEKLSSTVELAPRLGVYKRGLKQGVGGKKSAMMARESTIDFNKAGALMKIINQFVPFLNARVQGRLTVGRALINRPAQTMAKITSSVLLPATGLYLWNRVYNSELYDDIPEHIKSRYFTFIIGTAENPRGETVPKYILIPKSDVGEIGWNPIEYALDKFFKKDNESLLGFFTNWMNDVSPVEFAREGKLSGTKALGSVLPPIAKGGLESLFNINLYWGNEIVPYYWEKSRPDPLQYREDTPELYKALGAKLNMSPLKIQNLMGNVFASYGRQGLSPDAMLRGLTGRIIRVQGGEKASQASAIIRDIEIGYTTAREWAKEAIRNKDRELALKIMNDWDSGLKDQVSAIGKYGFKDRGGLYNAYRFSRLKRRGILKRRRDDRPWIEQKLSRPKRGRRR